MADTLNMPVTPTADRAFGAADFALYAVIVFAWGFSWYAIKLQLGTVDPVVSVAWRFWLAAAMMFVWVAASGRRMLFPLRIHLLFAGLGVFLFSSNFALFYYAGFHMVSGLLAVIFSTASVINVVNAMIFLREVPRLRIVIAALMGAAGLALIFAPNIDQAHFTAGTLTGLALALAGTLSFSFGNMISVRVQRLGLPLVSCNAYGMLYGALFMTLLALVSGRPFSFEPTLSYTGSLVYLALISTVVAFASYLTLLRRVGAARAAYVTVLFPLVALGFSSLVEDYAWTLPAVAGLALVIGGNVLIIRK